MTYASDVLDRIDARRQEAIAPLPTHDGLNWRAFAHVEKFSPGQVSFAERTMAHRMGATLPLRLRNAQLAELLRATGAPELGYAQLAGNLLVTEGLNQITSLIINSSTNFAFTNTKGLVTVGDSATAAAVGDTYVTATFTGTTNCYQNPNDASFPTQSNGVINSQSTYGSSVANFAWQTWGWASFNGTAAANATPSAHGTGSNQALLINHKVASLGTKGSGAAWVFSTSITLSLSFAFVLNKGYASWHVNENWRVSSASKPKVAGRPVRCSRKVLSRDSCRTGLHRRRCRVPPSPVRHLCPGEALRAMESEAVRAVR